MNKILSIKKIMGLEPDEDKKSSVKESLKEKVTIGIYRRVSTREQADEGQSLSAQLGKINKYIQFETVFQDKDLTINDYLDEGLSAKDLKRKGLQDLLSAVKQKTIHYVIVVKLDRLTRNLKDLQLLSEQFEQYNVKLISINEKLDTESATGRFFISILGSLAQLEREQVSERVQSVFEVLIYQKPLGGATSFGYVYLKNDINEGHYFPHSPDYCHANNIPAIFVSDVKEPIYTASIVSMIFDWFFAYGSLSMIARRLQDLQIPNPKVTQVALKYYFTIQPDNRPDKIVIETPGSWYASTIKGILLNPFYTGSRFWNRYSNRLKRDRLKKHWIFVEDTHPQLISLQQFQSVRETMKIKKRVINR